MNFRQWLETVYVGEKGLDQTWQAPFDKTAKCSKCGGKSDIAFVNKEDKSSKDFICDLHKNVCHSNKGKNNCWPHDSTATAVYICRKCMEPTAKMNQG